MCCNSMLFMSIWIGERTVMVTLIISGRFDVISGSMLARGAEVLRLCGWRLRLRRLWHAIIFLSPAGHMVRAEMSGPSRMLIWYAQIQFSQLCTSQLPFKRNSKNVQIVLQFSKGSILKNYIFPKACDIFSTTHLMSSNSTTYSGREWVTT